MRARGVRATLAAALLVAGAASAESPHVNYMLQCQGCHRADGSGSPGRIPDLRGNLARFLRAPGGRAFLVQVPGSASSPLSDAELAEVLNWMIRRFGPAEAGDFAPYSAAEVARHRRPLLQVEPVRRELLRAAAAAEGAGGAP